MTNPPAGHVASSARRTFVKAALGAAACAPWSTFAQAPAAHAVSDGAGRKVPVPARVQRIFPAGPPAAIQIYTLAPDLLLGWPRANRPEELEFLLPGVGNRPSSDASPAAAIPRTWRRCSP